MNKQFNLKKKLLSCISALAFLGSSPVISPNVALAMDSQGAGDPIKEDYLYDIGDGIKSLSWEDLVKALNEGNKLIKLSDFVPDSLEISGGSVKSFHCDTLRELIDILVKKNEVEGLGYFKIADPVNLVKLFVVKDNGTKTYYCGTVDNLNFPSCLKSESITYLTHFLRKEFCENYLPSNGLAPHNTSISLNDDKNKNDENVKGNGKTNLIRNVGLPVGGGAVLITIGALCKKYSKNSKKPSLVAKVKDAQNH